MKILFLGDIVGKPGISSVEMFLEKNKDKYDFIIANGENVTGGKGINKKDSDYLFALGIKAITMGNHTWDNKEFEKIADDSRFVRPLNYPPGTPGKGIRSFSFNNKKIWVINVLGTVFLDSLYPPFQTVEKIINEIEKDSIIIVDMHGEATSEKKALGHFLAGKVSAVIGTHTHVQTADEEILIKKTAYITDVGMCGSNNSVLGIKKEIAIKRFLTKMPVRFEVSDEDLMVNGLEMEFDALGSCIYINRINHKYY